MSHIFVETKKKNFIASEKIHLVFFKACFKFQGNILQRLLLQSNKFIRDIFKHVQSIQLLTIFKSVKRTRRLLIR